VRILIVEDHPLAVAGLQAVLLGHHEVVGVLSNGLEVAPFLETNPVDLVLLDLGLPGRNGGEVLRDLEALPGAAPVLVISAHDDPGMVRAAREHGTKGFVSKYAPANALLTAIETVAAGGTAFPDAGQPHVSRLQPDLTLTARQIEILQCEARGLLAKQTAHRLGISEDRVNEHLRTLRARLGAATNADLVRQAIEHGFLSPLTPLPPPKRRADRSPRWSLNSQAPVH
jgi:DNA-binding NarL/FixJ family response regulator